MRTVQEQIRTAQRRRSGVYRVTAPTAGIVGDIPVREGDRVTKATKLTSIDANAGLEVHLNVPVQQATKLKVGLPVRIVDTGRRDCRRKDCVHIADGRRADADLLEAPPYRCPARCARINTCARMSRLWTTEPGLTVPVTAVTRINGQWFAFVAEPGEGGKGLSRMSAHSSSGRWSATTTRS